MKDRSLQEIMLAVDVPATRADLSRAVLDGRRRAKRRVVLGSAAGVVVVVTAAAAVTALYVDDPARRPPPQSQAVAGPSSPAEPTVCAITTPALPAGATLGKVTTITPAGDLLGSVTVGGVARPVRWLADGTPRLGDESLQGEPVSANAGGVVVGFQTNLNDEYEAWSFKDGQVTMLTKLDGYNWTMPAAVNARGDIVGWAMGEALDVNVPVLWPAAHPGTVQKLSTPAGIGDSSTAMSRATGITDDGEILGVIRGKPVSWRSGKPPAALPLPAGSKGGWVSGAAGRYAFGKVYTNRDTRALRWDLRTRKATVVDVPNNHDGDVPVTGGSSTGWLLVTGDQGSGPVRHAPDGTATSLPGVPEGEAFAQAISDDGKTVVGWLVTPEYPTGAGPLIWRC